MTKNKELERLREFARDIAKAGQKWAEYIHPHYGPCDGFEDGMCAECCRIIDEMVSKIKEYERGGPNNTYVEELEKKLKVSESAIKCLHNVCDSYSKRLERQVEEIHRLRGSLGYAHKDIDNLEDLLDCSLDNYYRLIEEYYKNEGTPPPEEDE